MGNARKLIGIVAVAVLIFGAISILVFNGGGVLKSNSENSAQIPVTSTNTAKNSEPTVAAPKTPTVISFTMTEVRAHNSGSSCWSVVNGVVYDLTKWINQHPGGREAILSICGKDGSGDFNEQHGGQSGPEFVLAEYKIGVLKN